MITWACQDVNHFLLKIFKALCTKNLTKSSKFLNHHFQVFVLKSHHGPWKIMAMTIAL
jgi:hypothetical protein